MKGAKIKSKAGDKELKESKKRTKEVQKQTKEQKKQLRDEKRKTRKERMGRVRKGAGFALKGAGWVIGAIGSILALTQTIGKSASATQMNFANLDRTTRRLGLSSKELDKRFGAMGRRSVASVLMSGGEMTKKQLRRMSKLFGTKEEAAGFVGGQATQMGFFRGAGKARERRDYELWQRMQGGEIAMGGHAIYRQLTNRIIGYLEKEQVSTAGATKVARSMQSTDENTRLAGAQGVLKVKGVADLYRKNSQQLQELQLELFKTSATLNETLTPVIKETIGIMGSIASLLTTIINFFRKWGGGGDKPKTPPKGMPKPVKDVIKTQ